MLAALLAYGYPGAGKGRPYTACGCSVPQRRGVRRTPGARHAAACTRNGYDPRVSTPQAPAPCGGCGASRLSHPRRVGIRGMARRPSHPREWVAIGPDGCACGQQKWPGRCVGFSGSDKVYHDAATEHAPAAYRRGWPGACRSRLTAGVTSRVRYRCGLVWGGGTEPTMRCLYCTEGGASREAAAICTSCGAGVCVEHVVRTVAIPGIMTQLAGTAHATRGPLCCHHCTGRLAVPAGRAGGASTRNVSEGQRGGRMRWSRRRLPRDPRLTAADALAAVAAAERLVHQASGDSPPNIQGQRGLRAWWRALSRRLVASRATRRASESADDAR
jgi:hypothetical protein